MVAEGVPEEQAAALCARLMANDSVFDAARVTVAQLHKLESFLDVLRQMRALSTHPPTIDRRSSVSREEFLEEYYAPNRPVLLEDVCDIWPARGLWTPEYLVETVGDAEIEVMSGRSADPDYEMNADEHRRQMPFSEFVTTVIESGVGNDSYLVANNEVLAKPAVAPLWDDFTLDRRYLTRNDEHTHAFLWFGPLGTVTPLHHDAMNVLFNQVVGRKRFRLISPLESPYLYNSVSVYSDVDILEPNIERFPLFAHAHPIELVLEPGETLFVPVGWWHHVESLDLSISVSFTNFVFENDPEWYELEASD
jgi:ribosomal protein L16 Arg81 hydroxylase